MPTKPDTALTLERRDSEDGSRYEYGIDDGGAWIPLESYAKTWVEHRVEAAAAASE
jgi:hypothetical protein